MRESWKLVTRLLGVLLTVGLLACGGDDVTGEQLRSVSAVGRWGGVGAAAMITGSTALFEFDCAHGEIVGGLPTGTDGSFLIAGTFTLEGGPERDDDPRPSEPAEYRGLVVDDQMVLNVDTGNGSIGPITLMRDRQPVLRKCL